MTVRWLLCFLPVCALAQPFSAGIKIGAPVTDAFKIATGRSTFIGENKRFVVGPTVELRLPFGLGIEADALYRRYEYSYTASATAPVTGDLASARTTAGSWEFPVLLKLRGGLPLLKPFAVGGLSFRKLGGVTQTLSCFGGNCGRTFSDIAHDKNIGLVLGAGIQISALVVKISPEIRYTRWGFAHFDATGSFGSSLKSNLNQADVLIGITF
jgi:opacity protein-like surface antigen